jgi:hypothetical protein
MESTESESSLFLELNRVLSQAAEEVESEERLDQAYEVLETVRFEQSHILWIDRIRNTPGAVEFRINHSQLPLVVGEVRHLADPFIVIEGPVIQVLINLKFISAMAGLSELSQQLSTPDSINAFDNVWFHDLIEHRLTTTWYLVGDQVIEGPCLRAGFDAIDVESNAKVLTIPKSSIVAGRIVRPNSLG